MNHVHITGNQARICLYTRHNTQNNINFQISKSQPDFTINKTTPIFQVKALMFQVHISFLISNAAAQPYFQFP
jgi:hypothetical protein